MEFQKQQLEQISEDYVIPKCRVEPEINMFLEIFLEDILNTYFNGKYGPIHLIGKEFPLVKDKSQDRESDEKLTSYNVDYLFASRDALFFTELKAVISSFQSEGGKKQFNKYVKDTENINNTNQKAYALVEFLKHLVDYNEKDWKRYEKYLENVERNIEPLDNLEHITQAKIVYIGPSKIKKDIEQRNKNIVEVISFENIATMDLDFSRQNVVSVYKKEWELFKKYLKIYDELGNRY